MKIAVLYGGTSGERDVSLSTGRGVIEALKKNNHTVIGIDFDPKNLQPIIELDVDLVFIGLHGKYGEDGRIQGFLDMLEIPYVGSDVLASALAMDKDKAKQVFKIHDIPVAASKAYHVLEATDHAAIAAEINQQFKPPFVIKPNREGSTLGITLIKDPAQVLGAIDSAAQSDTIIMAEDFIKGTELTVPVLGELGQEKALPIIEIIPKNEFYDYESKYSADGSEHVIPARISKELTKEIQALAIKAHQVLGCKTYSRVDFILTADNIPVILEVNTLPGMTPTSLFPDSAKSVGMSYEAMIETFIDLSK